VLGVAFKPGIDDPRNSPAKRIIELLLSRGAVVHYHDPYVPRFQVGNDVFHHTSVALESVSLTDEELSTADCVVVVTGHRDVDYGRVVNQAVRVVDTCNAMVDVKEGVGKVLRLGAPGAA
jgi:UDP-N-acetyl-D-glucosamine dehydrogenase